MNAEHVDMELAKLLDQVRPELTPALTDRATAAIRSARPVPIRSRCRLIAVTVGAVVALFALGFVPFPAGSAKGALDKAAAALEGCSGLYVRRHCTRESKDMVLWIAPGGLYRCETWEGGKLVNVQLMGTDSLVYYGPSSHTAEVCDLPPVGGLDLWYGTQNVFRGQAALLQEHMNATVNEWRERSLWGGEVDVIEVTIPTGNQDEGKRKDRYETDAATGRLISQQGWESKGDSWGPTYWTEDVVWDADIPSDTWTFVPPKGTEVTYRLWWTGRVESTIASGETEDWQVRVHAIEAFKNGDLRVTLSREGDPEAQKLEWGYGASIEAEAVDNLGIEYHGLDGGGARDYYDVDLRRSKSPIPAGIARTITLIVRPFPHEPYADQIVTFQNLSLPCLQDKVEPVEEVVQY